MNTDGNSPVQEKLHSEQAISEYQFSANQNSSIPSAESVIVSAAKKSYSTTQNSLWLTPSVCTKKIDSRKFTYEKKFFLEEKWHENERRGIIFLGNEYAALQIKKSGEDDFVISYIESSGSEAGDDERKENVIWKQKISRQARNEESIIFKLKFKASKDGKNGVVHFFAKSQIGRKRISFKSKPFTTTNAHWVGGRYGFF